MRKRPTAVLRPLRSGPAVSVLFHAALVGGLFLVVGIAAPRGEPSQESRLAAVRPRPGTAREPEAPALRPPRVPEEPREPSLRETPPPEPAVFPAAKPLPCVSREIGLPPSGRSTGRVIRSRRPPAPEPGEAGGEPPKPRREPGREEPTFVEPKLLSHPLPEFRRRGTLTVRMLVLPDGTVGERVEIVESAGSASIDRRVRRCVRRWRFRPATRDGVPVEAWVDQRIRIR